MIVRDDLNPAQPRELAAKPVADVPEFFHNDTVEAANRRVAFLLRAISTMLAIAFFMEAAWLAWKPEASEMIYQVTIATAMFFFMLRLFLGRFGLAPKHAHGVATLALLVAIGYSLADLRMSSTPWATTQILIVVLVAGFVFASRTWFTILALVSCCGWFWAALNHLSEDAWVEMGGALLVCVIWSVWFLEMRLCSLAEFDRKAAQEDYAKVVEETQFFVKDSKPVIEGWCQVCKASADAVIRHDGAKIIDANPAAAELLKVSRTDLEGAPVANIFAPEKREALEETLRLGNFEPMETVAFRSDNTRVPVQMLNGGITHEPDGMRAISLRDLSAREREKENLQAATDRTQQLLRRQSELAALANTPETAENLDRIMNMIVVAAHKYLPSTLGVFVVLWDNHSQGFAVTAASAPGRFVVERLAPADQRQGLVGWLTTHNECLIVPNIAEDSFGVRALYPYQSVEAFAAYPLAGPAGVIGFLLALENTPRDFAPADLEYLTILAQRASSACVMVTVQEQLAYNSGRAMA